MLRSCRKLIYHKKNLPAIYLHKQSFLTNEYKCSEIWNSQGAHPIINRINLNDFYNTIDQNYSSKGVISAIDVDIFANAIKDSFHLDELKDLLHKLRLSAETGNMLESTHQATIRNYLQFGAIEDLINILKDPLNFGVFLDKYTANILLDKLVTSSNFEQAANVASLVMLQEDYSNDITNGLCQYACFKYIMDYVKPPEPEVEPVKSKKVEEIKIRIRFLRNPYFDDHFDIKDVYTLSGKTLAWISERNADNINNNLQIIGWLIYRKYDKLLSVCELNAKQTSFKIHSEVLNLITRETNNVNPDDKGILETCLTLFQKSPRVDLSLEESIKNVIENAINKEQNEDIQNQQKLFQSWAKLRESKLEEQTKRLDRAKRIEIIGQKQKELQKEEQKLWFFDNEDSIDLEIEEKEKSVEAPSKKKSVSKSIDEDYVPPEILPKRK